MGTDKQEKRTTISASIPAALKASLYAFVAASRNTGRTAKALKLAMTALLRRDADRVTYICANEGMRSYVRNIWGDICREHGINPNDITTRMIFVVVHPAPHHLVEAFQGFIKMPSQIYFDHAWLEAYHERMIELAHTDLVDTVLAFSARYNDPVETPAFLDTSKPSRGPQS